MTATRKLTSDPGVSVTLVPPLAQFPGAGQMVFVIVVVAWSSTLNGNRGVAPSLAGLTRELVMLTEVVADSSGAAPVADTEVSWPAFTLTSSAGLSPSVSE